MCTGGTLLAGTTSVRELKNAPRHLCLHPSRVMILTLLTDDLYAINPSTGASTRLVQNTSQIMRTPPEARRPEVGSWQPVGRRLMVGPDCEVLLYPSEDAQVGSVTM